MECLDRTCSFYQCNVLNNIQNLLASSALSFYTSLSLIVYIYALRFFHSRLRHCVAFCHEIHFEYWVNYSTTDLTSVKIFLEDAPNSLGKVKGKPRESFRCEDIDQYTCISAERSY